MIKTQNRTKIAYVGGPDLSLRIPILKRLGAQGYEVHGVGSNASDSIRFAECGIPYYLWPLVRTFSPWDDMLGFRALHSLFRREGFDLVHTFDTKPGILGRMAAYLAGVPTIVGTIPGLGTLFSTQGVTTIGLRYIYLITYAAACAMSEMTVFQNTDDMHFFIKKRIVAPQKATLIKGSGVDIAEFAPNRCNGLELAGLAEALGLAGDRVNFFMISRIVRHKGIGEFIEAAKAIKSRLPDKADFYLVGPLDQSIAAFSEKVLREHASIIRYIGPREDVRDLLCLADVVILPSYYREGIPRVLLEASAMGVPIITTLMPGCKEVVEDGVTGYAVPAKDPRALAEAMKKMINERSKLPEMGKRAREKVKREFSLDIVYEATLALYRRLLSNKHGGI
jgi:glycosyltransferase involved in cell wall biosynthesis